MKGFSCISFSNLNFQNQFNLFMQNLWEFVRWKSWDFIISSPRHLMWFSMRWAINCNVHMVWKFYPIQGCLKFVIWEKSGTTNLRIYIMHLFPLHRNFCQFCNFWYQPLCGFCNLCQKFLKMFWNFWNVDIDLNLEQNKIRFKIKVITLYKRKNILCYHNYDHF